MTGAFGTVGSATVEELISLDWQVIASDLHTRSNQKSASHFEHSDIVGVHWCDLTDPEDVAHLIEHTAPDVVVHLAAIIPPDCYDLTGPARAVNVEGTRHVVRACAAASAPPRLVLASSMAVYGPRNPHAGLGLLTAETTVAPCDNYGRQKLEAEEIVRASDLDWVILRLGGVLGPAMATGGGGDGFRFSALLPTDGNIQTVDVRDVARAFAAAALNDVVGQTLLIGGDDSHRRKQADIAELLAAMGLDGVLPEGRAGDPADDGCWFATDWMDTTASQAALDYQRISWPTLLEDATTAAGLKRYALRLAAPIVGAVLSRRDPYADAPGTYADVWAGIRDTWGPEALDGRAAD